MHFTYSTEKLVLQLSKKRSEAFLAFATLNPMYMSPNIKVGEQECKLFFPEGYDIPEEEIVETKKKAGKRRSKKSITSQQEDAQSVTEQAEGEAPADENQQLDAVTEEGEAGTTEEGEKVGEEEQEIAAEEAVGEGGEEVTQTEEADKATSPMTDEGAPEAEGDPIAEQPAET